MGKYERVMKKVNKFNANPKHEECYCLHDLIPDYLIPRLKMFVEDSCKQIDWDEHTRVDHVDVIGTINEIISDLEYLKEKSWDFTEEEAKECELRAKRAFKKLGEIFFYLWW